MQLLCRLQERDVFCITAPPFEHKGEEYKEDCADNGICYTKAPAMLIPDKISDEIALFIKLIHQLLWDESVYIF